MPLPKHYDPKTAEPRLQKLWQEKGIHAFSKDLESPVYSIDTPPATVSGKLHLGHVYSYCQPDFIARFRRMRGENVFYPMGYDDNGLPTERLVEKQLGVTAAELGRTAFIAQCLRVSEEAEKEYRALWEQLGISIDWRYTYRTIDRESRRTAQWSFLDLHRKDFVYRKEAPVIFCPECRTTIAQAELDELERPSMFYTLAFRLENGDSLPIATTRPELLPACVAVFVHPEDARFRFLVGGKVRTPFFGQEVPVIADPAVARDKGTGVVMCCTFGDAMDVDWWRDHHLPLRRVIGPDGRMTEQAGVLAGLSIPQARKRMVVLLAENDLLSGEKPIGQTVRIHERCDTPVEILVASQWFIRVLDFRKELLDAAQAITWHPAHMRSRYQEWVENLRWDWCISRQRAFGVPFPLWHCRDCGEVALAAEDKLPLDPAETLPSQLCSCGSESFRPEADVMDTWATSALTPQIAGRFLSEPDLCSRVVPMSLRPQAHDIIRTWAFYTIAKSFLHFGKLPWKEIAISGWGLAPEGTGKISKSRGGGPAAPDQMIEKHSADALRYWASSVGFGKDSIINEEKIQAGRQLATKLWNVARFAEPFLADYRPEGSQPRLLPADRWILSGLQRVIRRATDNLNKYEYAAARAETEDFFWNDLAGNYLEMVKKRLYEKTGERFEAARYALSCCLLTLVKLFAPFIPHVTEEIYQSLFAGRETESIHRQSWPSANPTFENDAAAEAAGRALVEIATAVRRYKSENNLPLGSPVGLLRLSTGESHLRRILEESLVDIISVTRAEKVEIAQVSPPSGAPSDSHERGMVEVRVVYANGLGW